jgi:hypothetical protein
MPGVPEYMLFKPAKFNEHIYQEVKRKKYLYYLELKRVQEKKKRGVLLMTLVMWIVI